MIKKIIILSFFCGISSSYGQQSFNSFYSLFPKQTIFPFDYQFSLEKEKNINPKIVFSILPNEKVEKKDVDYRASIGITLKNLRVVLLTKIFLDGDSTNNMEATRTFLCVFSETGKLIDKRQIFRNAEDEENKVKIIKENLILVETQKHQINLKTGQIVSTKKYRYNYLIDVTGKIKPSN